MTLDEAKRNLTYAIRWNDMPKKEALDMAIKALEQTTWIPCSERLPEEDGRYLCTYEDDIEENCVDFGSYENGEWYVDKVIAWMPLPKPYVPDINVGNMSRGKV